MRHGVWISIRWHYNRRQRRRIVGAVYDASADADHQMVQDRIAAADPKAGAQLIRDLGRGGGERPRKGDVIMRATKKSRRKSDR